MVLKWFYNSPIDNTNNLLVSKTQTSNTLTVQSQSNHLKCISCTSSTTRAIKTSVIKKLSWKKKLLRNRLRLLS